MKKIVLALMLFLPVLAVANEEALQSDDALKEQQAAEQEKPFEPIVHKVEKEVLPLPDCDDAKMIEAARAYITAYFDKNQNQNIIFRRRRHFILNSLDKFTKENVANYKTEETRPVSDAVIDLKMNHNMLEENMLLCKNQSKDKFSENIYLLVHPVETGFRVHIINLEQEKYATEKTIFDFEK